MKKLLFIAGIALLTTSCQKTIEEVATQVITSKTDVPVVKSQFVEYNILKGQQYCDKSSLTKVEYDELKFVVKFDSSAVYKTLDPLNQADINKLFGFSDNNAQHHEFSARFGWCWNEKNGLCLFGYTYNNSVRSSKLLGSISIGEEHNCSIKVTPDSYIFTIDGITETMPRTSATTKASGYKLYPYFGGDEFAPHNIKILIKEL